MGTMLEDGDWEGIEKIPSETKRKKKKLLLEKSTYYMQCVSSEISRALKITKNIKSLIGFLNYLVFEGEFEGA